MSEHNHAKLTTLRDLEPQRRRSSLRSPQEYKVKTQAHRPTPCSIRSGEADLQKPWKDKGKYCHTAHHEKGFTANSRTGKTLKGDLPSTSGEVESLAIAKSSMLKQSSRSPSPEKKVAMLRTLRAPHDSRKSPVRKCKDNTTLRPQAAATAATQAWSSRGSFGAVDSSCASSTYSHVRSGNHSSERAMRHHSHYATSTQGMEDVHYTPENPGISRKSLYLHQCETNAGKAHEEDDMNIFLESCSLRGPGNCDPRIRSKKEDIMATLKGTESTGQCRPVSAPTNNLGMNATYYQRIKDQKSEEICSSPNLTPRPVKLTNRRSDREDKLGVRHHPYNGNPMDTFSSGWRNEAGLLQEPDDDLLNWKRRSQELLKNLPPGVDQNAATQVLNEVIVQGDKVRWNDIAGLDSAKSTLKEAVVYPFLRPDLFIGLREPARGLLLFGPPGTGKTMLARAVATESNSTFFSISSSSLTSKYHGDSEKLVRALFAMARELAPSVIFVDEIDSLLSARSGTGEHEASRRMKTEFLIQWSDMAKAVAGKEAPGDADVGTGAQRVLILAATNLPWAIDAAARRRFVRRQYIPLPEAQVRKAHIKMLLNFQKHDLDEQSLGKLSDLTEGYSGSDLTELAKDAAMGPLRSVGDKLLKMEKDDIRPIDFADFEKSLTKIKPSVSGESLAQYDKWAKDYGERGG